MLKNSFISQQILSHPNQNSGLTYFFPFSQPSHSARSSSPTLQTFQQPLSFRSPSLILFCKSPFLCVKTVNNCKKNNFYEPTKSPALSLAQKSLLTIRSLSSSCLLIRRANCRFFSSVDSFPLFHSLMTIYLENNKSKLKLYRVRERECANA